MEQERFRAFLRSEYLKRRDRNSSYSLRSFAKHLQIDPGSLSQFMRGTRRYSRKKLMSLSLVMGLDANQATVLFGEDASPTQDFHFVELERMHLLSKWYYAAILESLDLDGFEPNPAWIAEKLKLSTSVVQLALNQLFAAGVLSLEANGSWKNNWQNYSTQKSELVDDLGLRNHQKQLLQMAAYSIDNNPAEAKSHTAYLSAMDSDLIPEIQEEMKLFRRKIGRLMKAKSKKRDVIYCLQLNLFPEVHAGGDYNEENN